MAWIKFPQPQEARLRRLLYMEYTLDELAAELSCEVGLLRRSCAAGCPHRIEAPAQVWIIGSELREWYATQKYLHRIHLAENEAYCTKCRRAVIMVDAQVIVAPYGRRLAGYCAVCGSRVNRFQGGSHA